MINKRLFGSDIPKKVKQKLELRQAVAGEANPLESIKKILDKWGDDMEYKSIHDYDPEFYDGHQHKTLGELSSRTAITRMWTAVSLRDKETVIETLEEVTPDDVGDPMLNEAIYKAAQKKANQLAIKHPGSYVIEIDGKWYVKRDVEKYETEFASKIYTIGNNNINYSINPNESLGRTIGGESEIEQIEVSTEIQGLFPQEQKSNTYLKPQAGITSVTSTTEGILGTIKKTTVNFEVHNFNDYDKIYNRYFLKPGAQIFVDFGWSSSTLYDPQELIDSENIKEFLYGEPNKGDNSEGVITKNQGDFETIMGIVTNFDAKIIENGSVQCMLELTSGNSALLGFKTDTSLTRNIQNILDHGVLYLGVYKTLSAEGDVTTDPLSDADQILKIPNADTSAEDLNTFNKNLDALAQRTLTKVRLTPDDNSIRTGIYMSNLNTDHVYISWGLFEDLVINSQFGFGKDNKDINTGNNLQVRMDSSNSFTTWSKSFLLKQRTLSTVPEEPPTFLIPEWWGKDPNKSDNKELASYSTQMGKSPDITTQYSNPGISEAHMNLMTEFSWDKHLGRIPIREVFINTDVIISAFKNNDSVKKALEDILKKINDESDSTLAWTLKLGETDSELTIVDNNKLDVQEKIDKSPTFYDDLFIFKVTSPNSIVKNYDISFNLGSGNIGNMYAIQAMSHENKIFPKSDFIDEALSLSALDGDNKSIVYKPYYGSYRVNQIDASDDRDASLSQIYQNAQNLLSENGLYSISAQRSSEDFIDTTLFGPLKSTETSVTKRELPSEDEIRNELIDLEIERAQANGHKVVDTFKNYFKLKVRQDEKMKKTPTLMPMTLSLNIYGIASLQPGDIFRVDYLPNTYKERVYFQTMKVTHNIQSDGWYTTLDTQYRIRPEFKQDYYSTIEPNKIILSPRVLENLKLDTQEHKPYPIQNLFTCIRNLRIEENNSTYFDFIFRFTSLKDEKDVRFPYDLFNAYDDYGMHTEITVTWIGYGAPSDKKFNWSAVLPGGEPFYEEVKQGYIDLEQGKEYNLLIHQRNNYWIIIPTAEGKEHFGELDVQFPGNKVTD